MLAFELALIVTTTLAILVLLLLETAIIPVLLLLETATVAVSSSNKVSVVSQSILW